MNKSKLPVVFGIGIAVVLILTFLIFASFGLHTNPIYSLINGVFMAYGMFLSVKMYKKEKGNLFKYEKGFVATFLTGLNATIIFTIFFALYGSMIEPDYISVMLGNWSSHYNTPEGLVVFVVFVMGMATTMVLTLAFMQLFKPSWNTHQAKPKIELGSI
ncbi:DUF4199 domain-containing protein [Aquimarina agarivorans]|uniref:DUF4199 domain-containing protein n=1 Tax=Aquimarina agarivorans TaxID=980584 RepID=UPI000248FD65|nr:DUF4199 domain-containing protein [Aquimarina agarivorans]